MKYSRFLDSVPVEDRPLLLAELMKQYSAVQFNRDLSERVGLVTATEYLEAANERVSQWGQIQGLRSGYQSIDRLTKGMLGGELMIIGGQTSHGKTQLALNLAYRMAAKAIPVLFVTLEMTKVELTSRLIKTAEPLPINDLPIFYQEADALDYRDIIPLIRRAKQDGAQVVFIDHLHYFVRSQDNQTGEIGIIVREFKRAAIECDVPIVLLSHVRKMAKAAKPELEDLRDSSFIAQDADVVLMVWRDMDEETGDPNEVLVGVLKNRNRGLFKNERTTYLHSDGARLDEA